MASKEFKVVSISSNMNAFGLRGVVVVSRDGEAWTLAGNDITCQRYPKGAVFVADPARGFDGYEIPKRLKPDPPASLLRELWPDLGGGEPAFVLACDDKLGRSSVYLLLNLDAVLWAELQDFHFAAVQCRNARKGDQLRACTFDWKRPLPLPWVTAGFVACLDQREHATPTAYPLPSVALKELGMVCYRRMPVELSPLDMVDNPELTERQLVLSWREQELVLSWGSTGLGLWSAPIKWDTICHCRDRALRAPTGFDALCRP